MTDTEPPVVTLDEMVDAARSRRAAVRRATEPGERKRVLAAVAAAVREGELAAYATEFVRLGPWRENPRAEPTPGADEYAAVYRVRKLPDCRLHLRVARKLGGTWAPVPAPFGVWTTDGRVRWFGRVADALDYAVEQCDGGPRP